MLHVTNVRRRRLWYRTHWGHKLLFSLIGCEAHMQIWLFYIINGAKCGAGCGGRRPRRRGVSRSPAALSADDIKAHLALLLIPPAISLEALICRTIISKIILKLPRAFETESLSDRLTSARGRALQPIYTCTNTEIFSIKLSENLKPLIRTGFKGR